MRAYFANGQVNFTGLFINEAGWYTLRIVASDVAEVILLQLLVILICTSVLEV